MFQKKKLEYTFNSLEPIISKENLDNHYNKNLNFYEVELNKALKKEKINDSINNIEELVKNYLKYPKSLHIPIRQYGGGLINHDFFFSILKVGETLTNRKLINEINSTFGSLDKFNEKFIEKAVNVFGSGWCWLVIDKYNNLRIYNTYNQDNPWFLGMVPLIAIDLWEHSYYEKYQDDRAKYISDILTILNWKEIEKIYIKTKK